MESETWDLVVRVNPTSGAREAWIYQGEWTWTPLGWVLAYEAGPAWVPLGAPLLEWSTARNARPLPFASALAWGLTRQNQWTPMDQARNW